MQEGDGAFGASARGAVDEFDPVDPEAEQRLGQVVDLEADVVEAFALAREEAGDAGRVVGRLDELDLRLADPRKAIRTRSCGMSMIVSSSRPSMSRHRPRASSIELTMSATWWILPMRRIAVRDRVHATARDLDHQERADLGRMALARGVLHDLAERRPRLGVEGRRVVPDEEDRRGRRPGRRTPGPR